VNEIGASVKNSNVETPLGTFSAAGFANGEEITVVVRPQAVTLASAGSGTEGYVLEARFLGDKTRLQVQFNGIDEPLAILLNGHTPQKGETARFRVDHDHVLIFTKPTPNSI
jgi:iron(III) transport system ATP-binding protein